jgi:hypothetical protein
MTATVLQEDERVCPYCAEVIKKAAVACRYCGRGLIDTDTSTIIQSKKVMTNTEGFIELKKAIAEYQKLGWLVVSTTSDSAQLTRPKGRPSQMWWAVWFGFFIGSLFTFGLLLIVPLVMGIQWWMKKPEMVILSIDEAGKVAANGNIPGFAPAGAPFGSSTPISQTNSPTPASPATGTATGSNSTAIIVVIVVIAVIVAVLFGCCFLSSILSALGNHSTSLLLPALKLLV